MSKQSMTTTKAASASAAPTTTRALDHVLAKANASNKEFEAATADLERKTRALDAAQAAYDEAVRVANEANGRRVADATAAMAAMSEEWGVPLPGASQARGSGGGGR